MAKYTEVNADDYEELNPEDYAELSPEDYEDTSESTAPQTMSDFITGLGKGASFGFSDELAGLVGAAMPKSEVDKKLEAEGFNIEDKSDYETYRDAARDEQVQAQKESPWAAGLGELVGGVATGVAGGAALGSAAKAGKLGATMQKGSKALDVASKLKDSSKALSAAGKTAQAASRLKKAKDIARVPKLGKFLAESAGLSGVYGGGISEAEDVKGLASDVAKEAALGVAFGAGVAGLGAAVGSIVDVVRKNSRRILSSQTGLDEGVIQGLLDDPSSIRKAANSDDIVKRVEKAVDTIDTDIKNINKEARGVLSKEPTIPRQSVKDMMMDSAPVNPEDLAQYEKLVDRKMKDYAANYPDLISENDLKSIIVRLGKEAYGPNGDLKKTIPATLKSMMRRGVDKKLKLNTEYKDLMIDQAEKFNALHTAEKVIKSRQDRILSEVTEEGLETALKEGKKFHFRLKDSGVKKLQQLGIAGNGDAENALRVLAKASGDEELVQASKNANFLKLVDSTSAFNKDLFKQRIALGILGIGVSGPLGGALAFSPEVVKTVLKYSDLPAPAIAKLMPMVAKIGKTPSLAKTEVIRQFGKTFYEDDEKVTQLRDKAQEGGLTTFTKTLNDILQTEDEVTKERKANALMQQPAFRMFVKE